MSFLMTLRSGRLIGNTALIAAEGNNALTLVPANPASPQNLNLRDPGGTDYFVYESLSQTLSNKQLGTALNANNNNVTNLANGTALTDAVNLGQLQNATLGIGQLFDPKWATAAALAANTYSGTPIFTLTATANGALSVDGGSPAVGDLVLVKNEATAKNNGLYSVTVAGDGTHPYKLTRIVDYDTSAQVQGGAWCSVLEGAANGGTQWYQLANASLTLDTSSLSFSQFVGNTYTGSNGVSVSGTSITAVGDGTTITTGAGGISIASGYDGQTSITKVGTIATGTWNASVIAIGKLQISASFGIAISGTGAVSIKRPNRFVDLSSAGGNDTAGTGDYFGRIWIKTGTFTTCTETLPAPSSAIDGYEIFVGKSDAGSGYITVSSAAGSVLGTTIIDFNNDGVLYSCDNTNNCWRAN